MYREFLWAFVRFHTPPDPFVDLLASATSPEPHGGSPPPHKHKGGATDIYFSQVGDALHNGPSTQHSDVVSLPASGLFALLHADV